MQGARERAKEKIKEDKRNGTEKKKTMEILKWCRNAIKEENTSQTKQTSSALNLNT